MGLSPEKDIKDYWTINRKKGVNHFTIQANISKN